MPVQRLKVSTLLLDLPFSEPVTHSGKILTNGKSHGKKPDGFLKVGEIKTLHESQMILKSHIKGPERAGCESSAGNGNCQIR
jgi:hypothetical protein